jgi:hypothetical protein
MDPDRVIRTTLWTTAVLNALVALLFAFPGSLGWIIGLPAPVPGFDRALLAFFIFLFGGMYAWLARRPRVDRPFVAFAAIGKTGVVVITVLVWLGGGVPGRTVALMSGDLVLAGIFAWWLHSTRGAG